MKVYNKTPPAPPSPPTDSIQRKLDRIIEKQAYLDGCIRTMSDSIYRVMDQILEMKGEMKIRGLIRK